MSRDQLRSMTDWGERALFCTVSRHINEEVPFDGSTATSPLISKKDVAKSTRFQSESNMTAIFFPLCPHQ